MKASVEVFDNIQIIPSVRVRRTKYALTLSNVFCGVCGRRYTNGNELVVVESVFDSKYSSSTWQIFLDGTKCKLCKVNNQFYDMKNPDTRIMEIHSSHGIIGTN